MADAHQRGVAGGGGGVSESEPLATPLAEFVADIERRRAAAGDPPIPRNPGTRRTASKRALLKAIKEAGGGW